MWEPQDTRLRLRTMQVPLISMVGYSSALRTMTSGSATFSMEFLEYSPVPSHSHHGRS
eukprot:m.176085 g.176085  ORF g.176085 m.176085 type:complete len:58 (-) comp10426_c0_seq9:983-1156(-)